MLLYSAFSASEDAVLGVNVLAWARSGRSCCSILEWNALVVDGVGFRVKGWR